MDEELRRHLESLETRMDGHLAEMEMEKMRNTQTELVRGFEPFSSGQTTTPIRSRLGKQ